MYRKYTKSEECNGWTNFATWKVNIEYLDGATSKDLFERKCDPNEVESLIYEMVTFGLEPHSFAHHCIEAFLVDVNWSELAEHLNDCDSTVVSVEG